MRPSDPKPSAGVATSPNSAPVQEPAMQSSLNGQASGSNSAKRSTKSLGSRSGSNSTSNSASNSASSSSAAAASSKNVSHVPCKFFRQGICQAGDSCPFSHAVEAQSQAVCKYFQKGNCKFGAKCALAHITPDGRRVSKKRSSTGSATPGTPSNTSASAETPISAHKNGPSHTGQQPSANTPSGAHPPPPGSKQGTYLSHGLFTPPAPSTGAVPISSAGAPAASGSTSVVAASPTSRFAALTVSSPPPRSSFSFALGTGTTSTSSSRAGSFHATRVESHLFPTRSGSSSLWSDRPKHSLAFEGSAIADDDEEEEEGFEEGLVPSSLSDLLTPQERERRSSRNSSSRPDLGTPLPRSANSSVAAVDSASNSVGNPAPASTNGQSNATDLWGTAGWYGRSSSSSGQQPQRILEPIGTPKGMRSQSSGNSFSGANTRGVQSPEKGSLEALVGLGVHSAGGSESSLDSKIESKIESKIVAK